MILNEVIEEVRKNNPYYESVFPEPTKEEFALLTKLCRENGLVQDKFFGWWGRQVWNNCLDDLVTTMENK